MKNDKYLNFKAKFSQRKYFDSWANQYYYRKTNVKYKDIAHCI